MSAVIVPAPDDPDRGTSSAPADGQLLQRWLPIDLTDPPSEPLNDVDEDVVEGLIKGYLAGDPIPAITVFPIANKRYEVLLGQHRLVARRRAGFKEILANVLAARPEPMQALAMQYKENCQHRELSQMERAEAYHRAKAMGNLQNKDVAKLFNVSEPTVSRYLKANDNLHPEIKKLGLSPKRNWALARLPKECQVAFYEQHKDAKADKLPDLVSDEIERIKGNTPTARPVSGTTPGGVKYTLPSENLEGTLAELKRLLAGVQWVISKKLALTDLDFYFRTNP